MTSLNSNKVNIKGDLTVTIINENEEIEKQPNEKDVMKNLYRVRSAEVF